jgi:GINS complex subunit 1
MQGFYGDKALKLVKECIRTSEPPIVPPYSQDEVRQIVAEIKTLCRSISPKERSASALLDLAIRRSKRCVLVYQRTRLDRIRDFWWDAGASTATVLNENVGTSQHETLFLKEYAKMVMQYKGNFMDIDLGQSLDPPRNIFVEIRVVLDCGQRMSDYGPIVLLVGTQHFIKRQIVEDLIQSGAVQVIS